MKTKIKPKTKRRAVKRLTFEAYLRRNGACSASRDFVRGKSYKQAYEQCDRPEWLVMLYSYAGAEITFGKACRLFFHLWSTSRGSMEVSAEAAAWAMKVLMLGISPETKICPKPAPTESVSYLGQQFLERFERLNDTPVSAYDLCLHLMNMNRFVGGALSAAFKQYIPRPELPGVR